RLELCAAGSWTAPHASELETLVDDVAGEAAKAKNVSIDMKGVRELDTFGAWILERLTRESTASGHETVIVSLPDHDRDLLKQIHTVNRPPAAPLRHANPIVTSPALLRRAG